jgi:hypothetical protein
VAFDERGEARTLYPTDRDRFFAGPGAALPVSVESRVSFQRDTSGAITSLTSQQDAGTPRAARRVVTEKRRSLSSPSKKPIIMMRKYRPGASDGRPSLS